MNLSRTSLPQLHGLAVDTAVAAGRLIQAKAGRHGGTHTKDGGDTLASQVVTEVDLQSQSLILKSLAPSIARYSLGVLTEESLDDASRFEADAFWCIDPIDGTLPFIEGRPGYSVSIALVSRAGVPLVGVVHDPASGDTFHAVHGGGPFLNNAALAVTSHPERAPLTWLIDRSMRQHRAYPKLLAIMERAATDSGCAGLRLIDHAGAALNGVWTAHRAPAVYFKLPKAAKGGGSVWDFAASACLLAAANAPPTDIHGNPLDLNPAGGTFMNAKGVLYASSAALHQTTARLVRQAIET